MGGFSERRFFSLVEISEELSASVRNLQGEAIDESSLKVLNLQIGNCCGPTMLNITLKAFKLNIMLNSLTAKHVLISKNL